MKRKNFTLIRKRLTPSGLWDNGAYKASDNTISLPVETLKRAVIIEYPTGLNGISLPCSRIDVDGKSYLVIGNVKVA